MADTKITALTEDTTPSTDDLIVTVNDPGGSPANRKVTLGNLPISTAVQTALDAKVDENGAITGDTKTKITYDAKGLVTAGADATKSDVGLGNVDNTSDADKPISTATQTALDAKVDKNTAITGATKTKITYDAKGLVTAGADATLASADFANQGTTTTVLHGNAAGNPSFGAVVEADMTLSDNTTNDVSTTKHGFVPKAPNSTTSFLRGDATWATPSVTATFPQGHIYGLTMSNAADATNDITVAAGEAISDDGTENMSLGSAITKQIDATWAVGTNQGGMNTGSVANSTWYEVHLIKRTDTGVVDVMFTTTANRSTLPTNYTKKRRIGWVRRATSTNLAFTQVGSYITLTTPQNDVSATATASATTRTLTAPPSSIARFRASCLGNTSVNAANAIVFSELVETDTAPTTSNGFNSIGSGDFAIQGAAHIELRVNSSSQIRDRAITATGSMAYDISTFGWIDDRGREEGM
jgi:hypothetical protein